MEYSWNQKLYLARHEEIFKLNNDIFVFSKFIVGFFLFQNPYTLPQRSEIVNTEDQYVNSLIINLVWLLSIAYKAWKILKTGMQVY